MSRLPEAHGNPSVDDACNRGTSCRLTAIYGSLLGAFGPQHWWPAETPFEVAVGAILTQNTSWKNVERAVDNLKRAGVLAVGGISRLPHRELAELIRPSGCHTVKAARLKNYIDHITSRYGEDFAASLAGDCAEKRRELLSVSGIGPETADSILLYAGGHPSFVVDAYTKRVATRHGLTPPDPAYEELRALFMDHLTPDVPLFNEYHALLVAVGKDFCKPREPRCEECPLRADRDT